tara:strand:+ start:694 stop:915 length:222 start_codon:yes stop_codon:yes gene_type:complete
MSNWWNKVIAWGQTPEEGPITIDVMKDDVDPNDVSIENAYKTRWIWYHTILAIGIFMTNILLVAILIVLAVKL